MELVVWRVQRRHELRCCSCCWWIQSNDDNDILLLFFKIYQSDENQRRILAATDKLGFSNSGGIDIDILPFSCCVLTSVRDEDWS